MIRRPPRSTPFPTRRSSDLTDWKLVEPTKSAAKGARVDDIVYGVRALRWKQIVAPNGEDAARYGLDAPTLEVVLLKGDGGELARLIDRKSTRLNSSHSQISYAVFCLKKK